MNILIISEQEDLSTNNVIGWLNKLGHAAFRINEEDLIILNTVALNEKRISLKVRQETIILEDYDVVWYRRGGLTYSSEIRFPSKLDLNVKKEVRYNLIQEEYQTLKDFIEFYLSEKMALGGMGIRTANKLIALTKAKESGLEIPDTLISTRKASLMQFYSKHHQKCISKGVQDILSFAVNSVAYYYPTSTITDDDLNEMDDTFFPSLLQPNIKKRYELRIFYLNKECYSMAIFSQSSDKTSVDFRNYNEEFPNRNVPYILPKKIKNKLISFMESMGLKTGSIDMIVTSEFDFIFLEVNPVGQYGMVSVPCNYELDKLIANELVAEI